ncbi:MAG: hypothetical protein IPN95_17140 [Bacteroidetes bacterium]|nr:hypothetical protein [Bacteroidota bacterium]MBL0017611.1 hypothetical protein [Bacteroidota bacterium]
MKKRIIRHTLNEISFSEDLDSLRESLVLELYGLTAEEILVVEGGGQQ